MESDISLSSDEEDLLINIILQRRLRRHKRKERRWWVHPLNAVRLSEGQYHTIMDKLNADPNKFYDYFRMSQTSFKDRYDPVISFLLLLIKSVLFSQTIPNIIS